MWIAGGVGITPFLATIDAGPRIDGPPPHLLYAVRSADENGIVAELERAAEAGVIRLSVFESSMGNRLSAERLAETVGAERLQGAHVALCGPAGLVNDMAAEASRQGAAEIETEDFDIRQGFDPDLSADIDRLVRPGA